MPFIPYISEVSALSGRSNSPMQRSNTSPDAYGMPVARALQESGQAGMVNAARAFEDAKKEEERKKKETVANEIALSDYTTRELEIRNRLGADSPEYHATVVEDYQTWVDQKADSISDDAARMEYKQRMMADLPNISSRSAQYQYATRAESSKLKIDEALNALQNKISLDPSQFDKFKEDGAAVIDAHPGMNDLQKQGVKQTWKYDAAKRRFDGMLNNVKTLADIDAIALELAGGKGQRDWQKEMLPSDYEGLMNAIGSSRKQFQTAYRANANATLGTIEERTKSDPFALVPVEDLREAQVAAKQAADPGVNNRMGRLMRNQEITRQEGRLPVAEIKARINASNGNPGAAYPGLPAEMSDIINKVSSETGANASFLGAVAMREYGSEFSKAKVAPDPNKAAFAPMTAAGVDLRNLRADVVDAVTSAGAANGTALIVSNASKGVTTPSSAVNILTAGLPGADKAKVVASLVDAGFTTISEYDGYVQADMTPYVPKSFGREENGKVWGGMTYLSPEVLSVLKEKGYAPGADASTVKRNAATAPKPKVNYDAATGITDANGNPTSSARGVFQFTEGTWLGLVKDPTVAAALGIDTTKPDAELLALRGDPTLSTKAAAVLATKNKKVLEGALGRPVNDAELYMAHFLGAGAASTFITAYQNNPDMSAAGLMPQAANANRPVFYADGQELTVGEVYSNIAQNFALAPSQVVYGDNEHRKAMVEKAEKELSTYPIQHAMSTGSHTISPLTEQNGFFTRGKQARAVADYNTIPLEQMKPFTQDEEAALKKTISEGTVDDNLALMANVQSMGPEIAKGALSQLGEKDTVFAHAAGLYLDGMPSVAGDIVRGRKRLSENPSLQEQIGADRTVLNDEFVRSTGGAVFDLDPARRQALQDAATALYVERMATGGGNIAKFDRTAYEESVQQVMGATSTSPAVATVNGVHTLIPRGLTAEDMETALDRMTIEDWANMSETGEPPRYADGAVVNPFDIKDEVSLRAIGGGKYKVLLDDGTVLVTGKRTKENRLEAYIFTPDPDLVKRIAQRPRGPKSYQELAAQGLVK